MRSETFDIALLRTPAADFNSSSASCRRVRLDPIDLSTFSVPNGAGTVGVDAIAGTVVLAFSLSIAVLDSGGDRRLGFLNRAKNPLDFFLSTVSVICSYLLTEKLT